MRTAELIRTIAIVALPSPRWLRLRQYSRVIRRLSTRLLAALVMPLASLAHLRRATLRHGPPAWKKVWRHSSPRSAMASTPCPPVVCATAAAMKITLR